MMGSYNFSGMAWGVHGLFGLLIAIGLVLLVVWIIKSVDTKKMLPWAIGLLVVGILGALLLSGFGFRGWRDGKGSFGCGNNDDFQRVDFNRVNWQTMVGDLKKDTKSFNKQEDWQDYMLEMMENHMGVDLQSN